MATIEERRAKSAIRQARWKRRQKEEKGLIGVHIMVPAARAAEITQLAEIMCIDRNIVPWGRREREQTMSPSIDNMSKQIAKFGRVSKTKTEDRAMAKEINAKPATNNEK